MLTNSELFGRESLAILEHQDEGSGEYRHDKGAYFESKTGENKVLCLFRLQKQLQKATRPQLFRISERQN